MRKNRPRILRRKSWFWLTWMGSGLLWLMFPFGVQSSLKHGNGEDSWTVLAILLVITALLRRIGSCLVIIGDDAFTVRNPLVTHQIPYSSVQGIDAARGGGVSIVSRDGMRISPFVFGGSVVDAFFRTSEKAAGEMRKQIKGSPSSDNAPLKRIVRFCWSSDVPLLLAPVSAIIGIVVVR